MKDTITALATPEGKGGLSVIRVSGPNALAIISAVFVPVNKRKQSLIPWHARSGWLYDPVSGQTVDEVIVLFFKAPKSYTGEDLLEISCHGNPLISSHILDIIISQGARPALPGEFTRRAFENGRIDLSQAEAVAQVTGAESEKATHAALRLLKGGLSNPVNEIRDHVFRLLTAIELDLDFPEEEATINESHCQEEIRRLQIKLNNLINAGNQGDQLKVGMDIVLAGRTNVGKSSVFNRLSGRDRAIVSHEPGTTRDALEARTSWSGNSITLIDTAGLRQTDSIAEAEAIRRATDTLSQAAVIVYIVDGADPDLDLLNWVSGKITTAEIIVFWNKSDIAIAPTKQCSADIMAISSVSKLLSGSAKTGEGIDKLRKLLAEAVRERVPELAESVLMLSQRQKFSLEQSAKALQSALEIYHSGVGPECAVPNLQKAHRYLGEITGDTVDPDILGAIFSEFCIGK